MGGKWHRWGHYKLLRGQHPVVRDIHEIVFFTVHQASARAHTHHRWCVTSHARAAPPCEDPTVTRAPTTMQPAIMGRSSSMMAVAKTVVVGRLQEARCSCVTVCDRFNEQVRESNFRKLGSLQRSQLDQLKVSAWRAGDCGLTCPEIGWCSPSLQPLGRCTIPRTQIDPRRLGKA